MAAHGTNLPSRTKPRSLRVGFFNINGIRGKRTEISQFVRDYNLDVFLIQETFLKPSQRDPNIPNYRIVRNDRTTGNLGGTLIYYKRSLHCIPLDPPELSNAEVSVCRLAMTGHPPITIVSVYQTPTKELLSKDLEILANLSDSVLLAGDLNAKHTLWNCNYSNPRGKVLERALDSLGMDIIAPPEPTHYGPHRPDILDIALVKNVCLRMRSVQVLQELDSDHRPVIIDFVHQVDPLDTGPLNQYRPMKVTTDWLQIGAKLHDTSSPNTNLDAIPAHIETPEEVTDSIRHFTNHLQEAIRESTREEPETVRSHWLIPGDLREVVKRRNATMRANATTPTPELRSHMHYLQREVKRRTKEIADSRWDAHLSDLKPTHLAFWQLCRSFRKKEVSTMPPLDRPNQRPAFDDDEKAEYLADSLEAQCSLDSVVPMSQAHLIAVNTLVDDRSAHPPPAPLSQTLPVDPDVDTDQNNPLKPVTVEEVSDLVRALKRRKAPGADGISNRVLKMLPNHMLEILTKIFNAAFRNCIFPQKWKEAVVIGIHKPGKPTTLPASYRPISLLSSLGKMYERIVLERLKIVAKLHHLLPEEQFGFRPHHNCVHQVLRITEHVHAKKYYKMATGALFFDIDKAFDRVWHNGLLFKLYGMNVPTQLVLIIRDFLSNRGFRYRVEGTLSSRHTITAGVPQGSALSPFLFSLYTSDIPKLRNAHLALFADDTAIYSSSRSPETIIRTLQTAADVLGEWFRKWRITVNPSKSAAIIFDTRRRSIIGDRQLPVVNMFGLSIPWTAQVKYLGVILDRRLTFDPHVKAVRARAAFAQSQLYWLLNYKSSLKIRNKIRIYKTCIRPIMTYASPAFAHVPKTRLKCLQVLQNRILRKILGAAWHVRNTNIHAEVGLSSIKQTIKMGSKRYFERAAQHTNTLIRQASVYTPFDRAKWRRPRSVLNDPDDEITSFIKRREEIRQQMQHSTKPIYRPRRRGPRRVPQHASHANPVPSTGPGADDH